MNGSTAKKVSAVTFSKLQRDINFVPIEFLINIFAQYFVC